MHKFLVQIQEGRNPIASVESMERLILDGVATIAVREKWAAASISVTLDEVPEKVCPTCGTNAKVDVGGFDYCPNNQCMVYKV